MNTYLWNDFDRISCTNGLYINVSHVFLPMQYIYSVINTLTAYLNEKKFPDDQYVSLTLSSPNGVASTLSFPKKSENKLFSNSRQTIVWKKNGEYSSLITRHSWILWFYQIYLRQSINLCLNSLHSESDLVMLTISNTLENLNWKL